MTKSDPAKKAYKEAIEELRNQYKTEIEPTIKTLIHLRDHAEKDKDRNEAAKLLLKTLGVKMTEERVSPQAAEREKAKEQEEKFELSPEYRARLDALLRPDALLGKK